MLHALEGKVNVIMSYEQNASIPAPYGSFTPHVPLPRIRTSITMKRPKLAVVILSNCASQDRNVKLEQLKQHIDLDVMGMDFKLRRALKVFLSLTTS